MDHIDLVLFHQGTDWRDRMRELKARLQRLRRAVAPPGSHRERWARKIYVPLVQTPPFGRHPSTGTAHAGRSVACSWQNESLASGSGYPSINNSAPVTDTLLSEDALSRLMTDGRRHRQWLQSLDRATHTPAVDEGIRWVPHATFTQIGWTTLDNCGNPEPLLMGVIAVRGRIVSEYPLTLVELKLNTQVVATATPVLVKRRKSNQWLYITNIWLDCNRVAPSRQILTLTAKDIRGAPLSVSAPVSIVYTPPSFDVSDSDAFVPSPIHAYDDLTEEVLDRPAMVRAATRSVFPGEIKRIMAMRVDQLGDVSATLPAMRRLRDLLPEAELTAVVSPAFADIVRATGLCSDVLTLSLAYDHVSEKRYLGGQEEDEFRDVLQKHKFDVAIDLSPAPETRALLRLVDAKYLVGFFPHEFPYLDFGITPVSRDKVNRRSIMSHASYVNMLVEGLAAAVHPIIPTVARQTDDTPLLTAMGLEVGQYVAIHSGARHKINCWPEAYFLELANRIAAELNYKVVIFSDAEVPQSAIERLAAKEKLFFPGTVSADQLAGLLARSRLMIGNDSGPKHLADVHGVDTISIHINRLNWREWGQSTQGTIISKRVPCCGCALNDALLCGKNVACVTSIKPDEVFNVVRARLIGGKIVGAQ